MRSVSFTSVCRSVWKISAADWSRDAEWKGFGDVGTVPLIYEGVIRVHFHFVVLSQGQCLGHTCFHDILTAAICKQAVWAKLFEQDVRRSRSACRRCVFLKYARLRFFVFPHLLHIPPDGFLDCWRYNTLSFLFLQVCFRLGVTLAQLFF